MTGLVSRDDGNGIVVSTTEKYSLLIEKIIDSKGENLISSIKPGDRFYTPKNVLNNSIYKRIIFNSKGKKTSYTGFIFFSYKNTKPPTAFFFI
jgi:hypothetical protein